MSIDGPKPPVGIDSNRPKAVIQQGLLPLHGGY
jgi:hypothetical protein